MEFICQRIEHPNLEEIKRKLFETKNRLEWWYREGFTLLESERQLTFDEWHELVSRCVALCHTELFSSRSTPELYARVIVRGVTDYCSFVAGLAEEKDGIWKGLQQKTADRWFRRLSGQLERMFWREHGDDVRLTVIDELALACRGNKERIRLLGRYRFHDDPARKTWEAHYMNLT